MGKCSRRAMVVAALLAQMTASWQVALFAGSPVPLGKPAHYPAWWFERDVIKRLDPDNTAPSWPGPQAGVLHYPATGDFAALNQGQLKVFTLAAFDEFEAKLSAKGGAGWAVSALARGWCQTDPITGSILRDQATGRPLPKSGTGATDFAGANLGQMKAVAAAFYDRLNEFGLAFSYPWTPGTSDDKDFALGSIGQAKTLFAFSIPEDPFEDEDNDGMPNFWELAHGLNPDSNTDAQLDPDGDDLVNVDEYRQGRNPNKGTVEDSAGRVRLAVFTALE